MVIGYIIKNVYQSMRQIVLIMMKQVYFCLFDIFPKPLNPSYDECQTKCEINNECDGWVYRYSNDTTYHPQCYLGADLPIDLVPDDRYVTGLNIESNQCDCICGDCYPGNKYHYIYIEDEEQFLNPLYLYTKLYSHSYDFSLSVGDSDSLKLTNLETGNV